MHHIRVSGVCVLILLIAATLPFNVLAQESSSTSGSEAASIISQSLAAKTSQEESISAEKVTTKKGLKPLDSTAQTAAPSSSAASDEASSPQASAAPGETETATDSAEMADDVAPSDAATDAAIAPAEETAVTPDEIETETVSPPADETEIESAEITPAEEAVVTPDEIEMETAELPANETDIEPPENTSLVAAVAPPENVSLGTEVSADSNASAADESLNASLNESENATAEDEVAEEDESEEGNESEEDEPVNRIWREGDPTDYTWNWKSFSGFFYDMENDVGTETLNVMVPEDGRTIEEGNLVYSTEPENLDFEYGGWGNYQVMGFMAEKYFAGYLASDLIDDDYSFLDEGQLRQVLEDSDDSQTLAAGSALSLEEGYELQIKQVDIDGEKVYLGLVKDGEEIDSKVVSPESNLDSSTYKYEVEVSGEDVPIIMAHIESVFASTESNLVTVDGLFQLSDTYASVEDGDEYDKMEVKSVDQNGVQMSNEDSINLKEGGEINIFGEVGFIVADDDVLRFAPYVDRPGPQEVRGSVIDPSEQEEFTWDVYNFEGFYYDIDEDVGTETLTARITDQKSIEEGDLLYVTAPQAVDFEFGRWGKYDVIGFMADKYFAGYNNRTEFTDDFSVIGESELRRVLVDNDDSQTLASGSVLSLEEGYELRIKSVDLNGNKVYLALSRDGEEVDSKVVTPSSDPGDGSSNYLYKVEIGSEEEVPIVAVHIESVFRSTESDLATVDGIFQVSDTAVSIEENEVHGKMEVQEASEDGITMENDGSFSLARDKTIEIMENLKFVVADSDKRLFAPVAFKPGEGMDMIVSAPDAVVNAPVDISVKSDNTPLAGVQIQVNGSSIGTTSVTGSVTYTPTSVGTYQVVGKKKDYNDGKASLMVRTASETASLTAYEQANATLSSQLTINAPADVIKGENFLIAVVQGINQTPVEGAEVSLDNVSIGLTGSQGTMTFASNLTGEHTLSAKKEGFNSAAKSITIASSIKVVELKLPEQAYAGKEMKISAVVRNEGSNEDTLPLDLLANGTVVESKNATVKGGENSTVAFTYKPLEPGLTELKLADKSQSINVEPAKSNNRLIALILVLLIAIGAGYYLYSTGELDSLHRKIKKMMQRR